MKKEWQGLHCKKCRIILAPIRSYISGEIRLVCTKCDSATCWVMPYVPYIHNNAINENSKLFCDSDYLDNHLMNEDQDNK